MSVKIRLQRRGTTNTAFYRIVVADSRSRRDGRFIEELGFYDPLKRPAVVKVDRAAAFRWLRNGATLSDTVERIFSKVGILSDWHRIRAGQSVVESGAEEMRIFQHKESAPRLSKKAKAKSAKAAEEKPAAEKPAAESAPQEA
jgi:small subunit ribosomal protein S16